MMKKLALVAGLLAVGAADASAQTLTLRFGPQPSLRTWAPSFGYPQVRHSDCQRKAWRLREYERFAASDGRISGREQREIVALRINLDRSCGRFRWGG